MKGNMDHACAARKIGTEIGDLILFATELGLTGLFFGHRIEGVNVPENDPQNPHLNAAEEQMEAFLDGRRKYFEVALDARGTDFQKKVWAELSRIPFGETRSYRQIAEAIGNPKGMRAVGLANGSNPISIIVPCHRVIGADGTLTGFGGGLEMKRRLLGLEQSELQLS